MKQIANAKPIPSPTIDDDDGLLVFREIAADVAYNANGAMPEKSAGVTPKRKSKKKAKPDPRGFRWQVRAWLDANKPDQLDLGRWIHELKVKRTFAPILRNALSLYRELMEGQVDMLYQLFPDVKPPPPVSPEKIKEMEDELKKLRKEHDVLEGQVEILQQVIISQRLPTAIDNAVKMASVGQGNPLQPTGPKMLTNNKPAPPPVVDDDDDDLVIRKDESSGHQAAINFMKSAFALNGMVYEESKQ